MTDIRIPDAEVILTDDSKSLISNAVFQMMAELRSGKKLTDVIADKLCCGIHAYTDSALPDYLQGGVIDAHNNAYFVAEYIINRVSDHDEAFADFAEDPEDAVRKQLMDLITNCTQTQAIRRMHAMLSCLRIARQQLAARYVDPRDTDEKIKPDIPPYEGSYDQEALENLMQAVSREVTTLTLSQPALEHFTRAIKANADVFLTSETYAGHCIEIKSLTAAVIYLLARKNLLPEVACNVSLDSVIASVCVWGDMQIVASTVEEGQRVFDSTKALLDLALMAGLTTLFVTLLKSGTITWLLELLLTTPLTLIIGLLAAFTLGPVIVSAVSAAENKLAAAAAQFTVEKGQTPARYVLSTAKDRIVSGLTGLLARFKPETPSVQADQPCVYVPDSANVNA